MSGACLGFLTGKWCPGSANSHEGAAGPEGALAAGQKEPEVASSACKDKIIEMKKKKWEGRERNRIRLKTQINYSVHLQDSQTEGLQRSW